MKKNVQSAMYYFKTRGAASGPAALSLRWTEQCTILGPVHCSKQARDFKIAKVLKPTRCSGHWARFSFPLFFVGGNIYVHKANEYENSNRMAAFAW